jgi:uncharacterized protein YeaO (DUF488 family)
MYRMKRIYEPAEKADGKRYLVDRMWPRGVSKERAGIVEWMKDIAPSDALCTWYGHDPAKWEEFRRRYTTELSGMADQLAPLREAARSGTVTLVFATRDPQLSNARVLKEFLEKK